MTTRRSYRQLCGLARALDLVGERWTLLIVRDLSLGARRYTDLLDGLPGIGEGLLAQRLRHLEAEGIAQRTFAPAPVNGVVYELTDDGRRLAAALLPLAAWGLDRLRPLDDEAAARPDHLAVALRSRFDASLSLGVRERYEMRVDDDAYTITADDGEVTVTRGADPDAVVHVATDIDTLLGIGVGTVDPAAAITDGRLTISGERDARARYNRMLRLPRPPPPSR